MWEEARVFYSQRWGTWRVFQGGDMMSEWETSDEARIYCEGFNDALKEIRADK